MPNLPKFAAALLAFLLLALTVPASAQVPGLTAPSGEAEAGAASDPSLDELIGILENEETRQSLIQSLKAAAYQAPSAAEAEGAMPLAGDLEAGEVIRSLPRRIANLTTDVAANLSLAWERFLETTRQANTLLAGAGSLDLPRVTEAILPVLLIVITTFGVLVASNLLKTPIYNRMESRAIGAGPLRKLFLLAVSVLIDALSIALAWAIGYLVGAIVWGGAPTINQALFLNAFLLIELIKVAMRALLSPNYTAMRLTPFNDANAKYWYFWLSRIVSVLGYTFLFVAPIVQQSSSYAAAEAVRFIAAFVTFCLVIGIILQNRKTINETVERRAARRGQTFRTRLMIFAGRVWWVLAIVFVFALFASWIASPRQALAFIVAATLKTIAALAVGGLIVSVLSRIIANGIRVPASWHERLPLLERRVNSFIPNLLTVLRVLLVVFVLAVVLEAWSIFDLSGWMRTGLGQRFVGGLVGAVVILVIAFAIYVGVSSWVEFRLNPNFGKIPTARERTLLALFRNAFTITLAVVVTMLVLSQVGINIGPLLAGAGVVGLAIGFGAQKFVQDIITGAFIQIQNVMNEGDTVELNGVSGTVEHLTVRSVALRTVDGTYYLIPFSSVDQVANFTKDFAYYVADIGVAYRESVDSVRQLMMDAFAELKTTPVAEKLIGDFEVWGVQALADSSVVVRGRVMTRPGEQWGVGRAYREIIKRMSDERGIEMPFPNMTVWFGEDKHGNAPPIHLSGDNAVDRAVLPSSDGNGRDEEPRERAASVGSRGFDRDGRPVPPDIDETDGDAMR